jgi:hypothetical protein
MCVMRSSGFATLTSDSILPEPEDNDSTSEEARGLAPSGPFARRCRETWTTRLLGAIWGFTRPFERISRF